jgi:hypothetical protein
MKNIYQRTDSMIIEKTKDNKSIHQTTNHMKIDYKMKEFKTIHQIVNQMKID